MRLGALLAVFAGAAFAVEGRARAEGVAFQDSPNPALAGLPRLGDLALHLGQAAAYTSSTGWRGVVTPGATWSVSTFDVTTPFKLRLEMPVLEERRGMQAGSLLATVGLAANNLRLARGVSFGFAFEAGVVAPSFGGETFEVAGNAFAERATAAYVGGSLPITLRALGVTAVFWSTPFAVANFELDYLVTRVGPMWLRAGAGLPVGSEPLRWFGGASTWLARQLELGASVSAANDASHAVVCELSVRWSMPTATMPKTPWNDADARALGPDEVRGRDAEALGVPGKYTVLELGATWCVPCREARPFLRRLAQRPDVAVRFVDVDECPEFAARYDRSQQVPMFIVLDPRGAIVRTALGARPETLQGLLPP
jgi:thiol-disulfide isomerase/thioredoxin